jgi:hypothetical protein
VCRGRFYMADGVSAQLEKSMQSRIVTRVLIVLLFQAGFGCRFADGGEDSALPALPARVQQSNASIHSNPRMLDAGPDHDVGSVVDSGHTADDSRDAGTGAECALECDAEISYSAMSCFCQTGYVCPATPREYIDLLDCEQDIVVDVTRCDDASVISVSVGSGGGGRTYHFERGGLVAASGVEDCACNGCGGNRWIAGEVPRCVRPRVCRVCGEAPKFPAPGWDQISGAPGCAP